MKSEIRIVGFDDGPFTPRSESKAPVIGVVTRGGTFPDGIIKTEVVVDGLDATQVISNVINKSKHKDQLKVVMFNGITIAGFNMIDIHELWKKTDLPVIIVNRKNPNLNKIKKALTHFKDFKRRWKIVKNAGKIRSVDIKIGKPIYYQFHGLCKEEVEDIIKLSCTRSLIPEPLRLAHLIASALVKGESVGRA